MIHVYAIDREARKVFTEEGEVLKILQFFDWEGDETDDPAEALSCTALYGFQYLAIDLTRYARPRVIH